MDDFSRKEEKLAWFAENKIETIDWERVEPDKKGNWIGMEENDWEKYIPAIDTSVKAQGLFEVISNGVNTARDEWVFDCDDEALTEKMQWFINAFNRQLRNPDKEIDYSIKWSEGLRNQLKNPKKSVFKDGYITVLEYRPYFDQYYYADPRFSDRLTSKHFQLFGKSLEEENVVIAFSGLSSSKPFSALGVRRLFGFDFLEKTQCLSRYRYDAVGNRIDNITNWGLAQFQKKYGKKAAITKDDIFHYVYAVLHHPAYRQKYAQNLKRDFPRIPLYDDFAQWAAWGEALMNLHLNYESAQPYPLEEDQTVYEAALPKSLDKQRYDYGADKPKLKADKAAGTIAIDGYVTLHGIPPEAWEYKLGNRSALEWILDQYKESTPKDPTIREKFNTYRFADYKEHVIDLLKRVATVSVETMKIVGEMPA